MNAGHDDGVLPDAVTPLSYRQRPRPLGGEIAFTLEGNDLMVDSGRKQERIAYTRIASARLTYRPSNASMHAFRTVLRLGDGRAVTIGNVSWRSHYETERHDAPYRDFITALLARVQAANPEFIAWAGAPLLLWAPTVLVGAVMVAALGVVAVRQALNGAWPMLGLAAIFLVPLGWQVWAIATRNYPRRFRPPFVPRQVLP